MLVADTLTKLLQPEHINLGVTMSKKAEATKKKPNKKEDCPTTVVCKAIEKHPYKAIGITALLTFLLL